MSADPRNDFSVVRRGYNPEQVKAYIAERDREWENKLTGTAEYIDKIEAQLAEAKSREEAVHLTLVAATKTKEELLESAKRQLEDAKVQAQEEATTILADAKREAFEMVTQSTQDAERGIAAAKAEVERIRNEHGALNEDARGEADEITAHAQREAEDVLTAARNEAEATLASARSEALTMLSEIKEESERMVAERDKELERIRAQADSEASMTSERLRHLKTVATDLEERLRLLASGAVDEVVAINSTLHQEFTEDPRLEQVIHQSEAQSAHQAAAPHTIDAIDETEASVLVTDVEVAVPGADETTVQVIVDADDEGHERAESQDEPEEQAAAPMSEADVDRADLEADAARAPRGSFYSRRSARLPRIGADAASGALAAVSAMRARAREEADLDSKGDLASSEDLAMQTA